MSQAEPMLTGRPDGRAGSTDPTDGPVRDHAGVRPRDCPGVRGWFAPRARRRWLSGPGSCRGATTLEWTLLLAAVALPSYGILMLLLETITAYYGMMLILVGMPLP